MSSYYGGGWPTLEVGVEVEDDSVEQPSDSWLGGSGSERRSRQSSNNRARAHGERDEAEYFELASNASSNGSWWKSDSWSWDSWDGSAGSSRENWVYVNRGEDRRGGRNSDPWHWWHNSSWSQEGGVQSGEERRSANQRGNDSGNLDRSGDSGGDDHGEEGLPSGKVLSVHEKVDKEEEKKLSGKVSSSYPPVFKARQGESYRDWKRAVRFWLKGEGQQLPTSLVGPRVMVQLRDRAAALVKHLEPEDVDGKGGLDLIFATLEKAPLIKQSEKHRVDWHRKRLLNLTRLSGESMESYITRASLYRNQLEGLDATLCMGERFFVGHLMDHARLTRRDKAMVKTHAGEETENRITEALIELAAELEGESGYPIGQSESQLSHTQGEEHLVQRGFLGHRYQKKDKAAFVTENDEVATQLSLEGIPEETAPGEDSLDDEPPLDVLHAEHEALALQFKAKQKMAEVKKMRNYFRKGDPDRKSKIGKCFVCDEVGHFAKDCPKVKAANGNQVLLTTAQQKPPPTEDSAEWALLASLCKDTVASAVSANEVYMVSCGEGHVMHTQQHDTTVAFEAWWNMKELARKVILDLGCMRNVVGVQWANDVVEEWKRHDRWIRVLPEEELFRFGNGNTLRSKYRLQIEATFGGKRVLLAFSVVPGPCPPLLSKQSHTLLGVQIDTCQHTMSSKRLGIKQYGLSENAAGHYTVRVDEFHLVEQLPKQDLEDLNMDVNAEVALFPQPTLGVAAFGSQLATGTSPSPTAVNVCSQQSSDMSSMRRGGPSDSPLSTDVGGRGLHEAGGAESEEGGRAHGRDGCIGGGPAGSPPQASSQEHGCGEHQGKRKRASSPRQCGDEFNEGQKDSPMGDRGEPGDLRPRGCGLWGHREGNDQCRGRGRPHGGRVEDDLQETREAAGSSPEEGAVSGLDGVGGQLSLSEQCVERRPHVQRPMQHEESATHISVEETGVAVEDSGSDQDRIQGQGHMEEESQMAQPASELRDSGSMGTLWCDEADASQLRLHGEASWQKLNPQRGLMQKIKSGLARARDQHVWVTEVKRTSENYLLLEIFAGCAKLTEIARGRDGWQPLQPVDLKYGYDLHNSVTRTQVMDTIRRVKPDLVTMSPRCGPWSQFQRINPNIDKIMEDRKNDIPLWRFCRAVWDEQTKEGRLALTENPYQSEALHLDFMEDRLHLYRAKVPQCAFGLKDVVSGKPHQKYTAFDVNDVNMRDALMEGAVCNHLPEEHQPIEGSVMYEGRSQKRSALASRWPSELCEHILKAAEKAWEKCDSKAPQDLCDGREPGVLHYALPVEPLASPEGELRRQLEKADWRGGQYDYVYFQGASRQGPYKVRQALAHLHVVLGHPSADRLKRMLQISGCSSTVLQTAEGLTCQICQAVRPPGAEPKVSSQRPTRFGERILSDSFYVWDMTGERFNVTHVIDGLTEYHVGSASKNPNSYLTTELLQEKWCAVFGPPEVLQTDGGKEYEEVVPQLGRLLDFRHEVVPPGAKWRQGQVERHGAIVKLMMMRTIHTQQVKGLEEIRLVAAACFSAKNRLCNKAGLSPLQAVTGKDTVVPTSIMDQLCSGHVKFAMNTQLELKEALRRAERIRASAVDSFNWIDCNDTLRRALHARSRPPKLEGINEGATVYVHQPPPCRRGQARRLQDHASWDGPGVVVCVERQQNVPNRVWVRIRGKVRSFPLEKIRMATPDEMLGSQYIIGLLDQTADEIRHGKVQLEADSAQPTPSVPKVPRPRRQAQAIEEEDEEMEAAGPQRGVLGEGEEEERLRQVRRMEMLNDVPSSIQQALSSGSSSVALKRPLMQDEREDLLAEDDETLDSDMVDQGDRPEPSGMNFQRKKELFESLAKKGSMPSTLTEAQLRSGMAQATQKVKNIRKMIRKSRQGMTQRILRQQKTERAEASSMVLFTSACEKGEFEKVWEEAAQEWRLQEIFWTQPEIQKSTDQQIREQVEGQQKEHHEALQQAQLCPAAEEVMDNQKLVTGKARLEYNWNQLSEEWKKAFKEPLLKAVKIYFDHDALAGVPKDQVLDPKRILNTRFVLTNKGGAELKDAILKGRLVLGGHRDPDAGRFPTLAPTAALLGHNLVNWIAVQMQWVVCYEDVSSAFLQGKPLPSEREIYIRIPRGYPDYIEKYILENLGNHVKKDIMKMVKGGFGLPESPRLWYLEYKETLNQCGMREMHLLPGVFAAHHPDGTLRALACIHVDDTRFCGDTSSQEIWDKIHQCLNFGDMRKATEGWTKFCGRWERQNPDTLEFEYSMDNYAKDLQKMRATTLNAIRNKVNVGDTRDNPVDEKAISPEERLGMSSVLGQLNWMARQGRYDLSYGVSNVQQLAAKDGAGALDFLNKVIYRAKQPTVQVIRRLDDWRNAVVISASDAAFGAQPGGGSQGGYVVGLADAAILEGEAKIAVMEAASMKIQRVVRCSMSAEVSMAATSFEHGDFVRAALSELLNGHFVLKDWKLWSSKMRHFLVIDAKTGFDVLNTESQTSDRKIQIDLAVLKQALVEETSNSFARWVPGHHMIADGTTKWFGNKALQRALEAGIWSLKDTPEAKELREAAAHSRRQLKNHRKDQGGDVLN